MNVREVNADTCFTPASAFMIEVSRDTYREFITDDQNFHKAMTPEFLNYYATAMLWFRITALKWAARDCLTIEEERLLRMIEGSSFAIPEPILLQYKLIGRIHSPGNICDQNFLNYQPQLSEDSVDTMVHRILNTDTHNLYEKIPWLGVLNEAVRHAVSDAPLGPYVSALTDQQAGIVPNVNLLGYRNLMVRRPEAKNLAFDANVTQHAFPSTIPNVGINLKFLLNISGVLAQTKSFKISNVDFTVMAKTDP